MYMCIGWRIKRSRMRLLNYYFSFVSEFFKGYSFDNQSPLWVLRNLSHHFIHSVIYHHLGGINVTVFFGDHHKTFFFSWVALIIIWSFLFILVTFLLSLSVSQPVVYVSLSFQTCHFSLSYFLPPYTILPYLIPVNWCPLYIKNNIIA